MEITFGKETGDNIKIKMTKNEVDPKTDDDPKNEECLRNEDPHKMKTHTGPPL